MAGQLERRRLVVLISGAVLALPNTRPDRTLRPIYTPFYSLALQLTGLLISIHYVSTSIYVYIYIRFQFPIHLLHGP